MELSYAHGSFDLGHKAIHVLPPAYSVPLYQPIFNKPNLSIASVVSTGIAPISDKLHSTNNFTNCEETKQLGSENST
jgi:hypothetical protein